MMFNTDLPYLMTPAEFDAWQRSDEYQAALASHREVAQPFEARFYERVAAGLPALGIHASPHYGTLTYLRDPALPRHTWYIAVGIATYPRMWSVEQEPTFMWVRHLREVGEGDDATMESRDVIDLPYWRNDTSRDADVLAEMALAALRVSVDRVRKERADGAR